MWTERTIVDTTGRFDVSKPASAWEGLRMKPFWEIVIFPEGLWIQQFHTLNLWLDVEGPLAAQLWPRQPGLTKNPSPSLKLLFFLLIFFNCWGWNIYLSKTLCFRRSVFFIFCIILDEFSKGNKTQDSLWRGKLEPASSAMTWKKTPKVLISLF